MTSLLASCRFGVPPPSLFARRAHRAPRKLAREYLPVHTEREKGEGERNQCVRTVFRPRARAEGLIQYTLQAAAFARRLHGRGRFPVCTISMCTGCKIIVRRQFEPRSRLPSDRGIEPSHSQLSPRCRSKDCAHVVRRRHLMCGPDTCATHLSYRSPISLARVLLLTG